jgi:hypothetical protein
LSDEIAEIILDFFLSKRKNPDTLILGKKEPDYLNMQAAIPGLLENVRQITRGLAGARPVNIRLPKKITLVDLYRLTRPSAYPGEDWIERAVGWLSNILINIAPELVIRETGMNKAEERVYKAQWNKVEIRPDLETVWAKWLKSLLAIQASEQ